MNCKLISKRQFRKNLKIACLYFEDTQQKIYLDEDGNIENSRILHNKATQTSLNATSNILKYPIIPVLQLMPHSQLMQSSDNDYISKSSNSLPSSRQNIQLHQNHVMQKFPIPILNNNTNNK